jgi:L,D-transpeptidase YcbB
MPPMKNILIVVTTLLSLSSCTGVAGWFGNNSDSTKTVTTTADLQRDETITPANSYSDLFLDSNSVRNYIDRQKLDPTKAQTLKNFYAVRNNEYAWFTSSGLTEEARGLWTATSKTATSKKDDKKKDSLQQRMDSLVQKDSINISTADSSFAQAELALTSRLIDEASNDSSIVNKANIYYLVPRKKMSAMEWADSILNKQQDSTAFASNPVYNNLKQQLNIYYTAAKNGGWQNINANGLKKGSRSPVVAALKKRLQATNDYPSNDTTNIFSDSLVAAVKDVQSRFGLMPTGNVTDSLVKELNVPAEQRLQQIVLNINRTRWMKPVSDSNRIEINIPAQMLYAYKGSSRVFEMPVIVGEDGKSTTAFSGKISEVVFNPTWNVPESIVRNEIVPAMKNNPHYLEKKHMQRVGGTDSLPVIKQLPGKDNALGHVKFLFPNSYDIYLHDSPDKTLFAKKDRRLSHGCIRVQNPRELAAFILGNDWSADKINNAMKGDKEQAVTVNNPVPVQISYLTAWVDEKGKMNFRPDNYGHDQNTAARMFTGSVMNNMAATNVDDTTGKQKITKP